MIKPSKGETAEAMTPTAGSIGNSGEPLRFANVENLAGFALESAQKGQIVKIRTRLAVTSDHPLFHRLIEHIEGVIAHMARQSGTYVRLNRASTILLVLKADKTAELWLDTDGL